MATTFEVVRAQALFVSCLQASQRPKPDEVRDAITTTLRWRPLGDCVARVAEEFGNHPETAAARMNWALSMVRVVYATAMPQGAGRTAA